MAVQWGNNPDHSHAADRRRKKGEPRALARDRGTRPSSEPIDERAVLVGIGALATPEDGNLWMLDELAELARTAGAKVMGRLYQRLEHPHGSTWIGAGKVTELKEQCEELEANLVIADSELSPAQVRNLEAALDMRVIDRSELIIDIFARHARTRQARLQVELAQLEYMAPRLKRMWTHLSRITGAGGIGSRGPGEKQLEVDRRIIQRRIHDLKSELKEIEEHRGRMVSGRDKTFTVALVGYTNAGKSTIMKALTGADVYIANQLFATLDTRTRRWELGDGLEVLLSDTVGFVKDLPHHLVASFHATLEEVREADLLLHVVDASDPDVDLKVQAVRGVLRQIGAGEIAELLVLNKIDLLDDPVERTILARRLDARVLVSAVNGLGLDELATIVGERLSMTQELVELRIPVADGRALALVARVARVIARSYEDETCCLRASIPPSARGELERYIIDSEGGFFDAAADDRPR